MNILIPILLLCLAFAGIAIKILLKKDVSLQVPAASNNPMFQNEEGECSFCGANRLVKLNLRQRVITYPFNVNFAKIRAIVKKNSLLI